MALVLYLLFLLYTVDIFQCYVQGNILRFLFNCILLRQKLEWRNKLRGFCNSSKER